MRREIFVLLIVIVAALFRVVPHPPNFTPVTALALFSGVYFSNRILGILIPICVMILSDTILGFYEISYFVYFSFILVSIFGLLYKKVNIGSTVVASLVFFLVSNLGVWLLGYPKTVEGFITCYTLALPFLGYSLIGDLFYITVLKYSFKFVESRWLTTVY